MALTTVILISNASNCAGPGGKQPPIPKFLLPKAPNSTTAS